MRFFFVALSLIGVLSGTARGDGPAVERDIESEIRALVHELNAALAAGDGEALKQILAEDFTWVHALGYADDRAAYIADALSTEGGGRVPIPTFEPPKRLLVHGDVAIYTGPGESRMAGRVWGTEIYSKRDGRWRIVHMQGTPLQPERAGIDLPASTLDAYCGRYANPAGAVTEIRRRDGALVARHPGRPERTLKPTSETVFFDKLGLEWTFHPGADDRPSHFVVRLYSGEEVRSERLPDD